MIPQSKGKMFLSDERGLTQHDWYRSYHTFNFGNYYNGHKQPFSNLYVLNDDTLAAEESIRMSVKEHTAVLLIPVIGAIGCRDHNGDHTMIEPGMVQLLALPPGSGFQVNNPYKKETDLVNFLQLWIKIKTPANQDFSFDLPANRSQLTEIFRLGNTIGYMGQFDGRAETTLRVGKPGNALFAYVIEGAFEVQYRLMHARDGLVLWDLEQAGLEALSNNAIIMLIEIAPQ